MRRTINGEVLKTKVDFLCCNSRSNKPRISYLICVRCIHQKKCLEYKLFRQTRPDLYPEEQDLKKPARKKAKEVK